MLRRKRELIVPIHDRRKHVRILTIRNFLAATAVVIVVLVTFHVVSAIRAPRDGYGRLLAHESPDEITPKPPLPVVHEAPVPDTDRADATLMPAMARAQYLGAPQPAPATPKPPALVPSDQSRVQVVGGASGVTITSAAGAAMPKLKGGIFKRDEG
jgi:hypothetical protein